jgi:hypothetical protein
MTGSGCQDLIEGNHNFQRDQRYDNQFETQGPLRVDDVSERGCGFGDDRKFSVKRVDALSQFVLIFQTGVEPFQIRTVPQRIGLLGDGDPTGHAVLYQQGVSDQLQDAGPVQTGFSGVANARAKGSITSNTSATRRSSCARTTLLARTSEITSSLSGDIVLTWIGPPAGT